jgi:hypothetical protein
LYNNQKNYYIYIITMEQLTIHNCVICKSSLQSSPSLIKGYIGRTLIAFCNRCYDAVESMVFQRNLKHLSDNWHTEDDK